MRRVGEVEYGLALPLALLAIHTIFNVSMLRRYILDESQMLQYDFVELDNRLTLVEEPTTVIARYVCKFHSRSSPIMKVQW